MKKSFISLCSFSVCLISRQIYCMEQPALMSEAIGNQTSQAASEKKEQEAFSIPWKSEKRSLGRQIKYVLRIKNTQKIEELITKLQTRRDTFNKEDEAEAHKYEWLNEKAKTLYKDLETIESEQTENLSSTITDVREFRKNIEKLNTQEEKAKKLQQEAETNKKDLIGNNQDRINKKIQERTTKIDELINKIHELEKDSKNEDETKRLAKKLEKLEGDLKELSDAKNLLPQEEPKEEEKAELKIEDKGKKTRSCIIS